MVRDRIRLLIVLIAIPFFIVLGRLATLQLFAESQGEEEMTRRLENRRRRITLLPPTRGSIVDRNGSVLARDDATFSLEFTLYDLHPRERYLPVLEKALGLCDDRCLSGSRPGSAPDEGGGCRGLVLEERLHLILGEEESWMEGRGEGDRGAEPALVENIATAFRARLDQKLGMDRRTMARGVRALEQTTGIYFLPDPGSNVLELRVVPRVAMSMELTL